MKKPQEQATFAQLGEFSDGITRIIQLFEEHEATLQFPGINAQILRQQVDELELCQNEVESLEALAAEARERLVLCTARLLDRARQAQAYAQVFVSAQVDEAADQVRVGLSGIELTSEASANRPRKARTGAAATDPLLRREKPSKSLVEGEKLLKAEDEVAKSVAAE